jgi:hypothetical protein
MTAVCYTPFKVPRVRVTTVDVSCGQPVTGSCATVVTDGIISIAMTKEYEAREEFFVKNGDGVFCVRETTPPQLKWINLVLTFCNVDPELVNMLTAEPVVYDDADSPRATGYSTQEGSAAASSFGFEGWTRITGSGVACTGGTEFGYVLFPWIVEGTIGDVTLENGAANFVVNARTKSGSLWGTGPYFVDLSDATATLDNDIALLTAIGSTQHHRMFLTRKSPPTASCGCQPLYTLTP